MVVYAWPISLGSLGLAGLYTVSASIPHLINSSVYIFDNEIQTTLLFLISSIFLYAISLRFSVSCSDTNSGSYFVLVYHNQSYKDIPLFFMFYN